MSRLNTVAALVTGASRGIGLGIARAYLHEGARVFLSARGAERLAAVGADLKKQWPGHVEWFAADLGDPESARELAAQATSRFPDLSVLVNNASLLGERAPITEQQISIWDETLRVNTSSLFYLTKPLLPALTARPSASVINVSSTVGRIGKPNWGPYAVSKFGLEGFTQVLAAELAETEVRVNSVNPGATRTDMRAAAYPDEDPLTLPTPEDIAEAFVLLATPGSDGRHGEALNARDFPRWTPPTG